MVATSATRDASNRDEFFAMTRELLGVEAEVITGDEEARLSFTGAVGDLEPDDGPFVVADIGGGSTELVVGTWDGKRAEVTGALSVDIGCVRITERCLPGDPPTEDEIAQAAGVRRRGAAAGLRRRAGGRCAHLGRRGRDDHHALSRGAGPAGVRLRTHAPVPSLACRDRPNGWRSCSSATRRNGPRIPAIHPGRVDVIGGGALITDVLAEKLAEARRNRRAGGQRARHPRRDRAFAALRSRRHRDQS